MTRRRVVITGVGIASPIGNSMASVTDALRHGAHGIRVMPEWDAYGHLATRLGAPASDEALRAVPARKSRTMGRVSLLALHATLEAIERAGLTQEELQSQRCGIAYGSTHGSSAETEAFCRRLFGTQSFAGIPASTYLRFMSHTCASNLAVHLGTRGRILTTCSACVSGSQAIGLAYETIRHGLQDVMIAGGAEELHVCHAGVFDIMFATSRHYNDQPDAAPRPFDADRDGLVVGEGAGTVVLEDLDRARARGASILAEVLGFGTNSGCEGVTTPSVDATEAAIRLALEDAGLPPEAIDYVNAHGTATESGDIAESQATARVFGSTVPVSSTKGHVGHTLGASGSIETIFCLAMMQHRFVAPTRTLVRVDPRCGELDYVIGEPRRAELTHVMNNNFAFGGIHTSLVFGAV